MKIYTIYTIIILLYKMPTNFILFVHYLWGKKTVAH